MTHKPLLKRKAVVALAGMSLASALFCASGSIALAAPATTAPEVPAKAQPATTALKALAKAEHNARAATEEKAPAKTPKADDKDKKAEIEKKKAEKAAAEKKAAEKKADYDASVEKQAEAKKTVETETANVADVKAKGEKKVALAEKNKELAEEALKNSRITQKELKGELDIQDGVLKNTAENNKGYQAKYDKIVGKPGVPYFPGFENLTDDQFDKTVEVLVTDKVNTYRKQAGLNPLPFIDGAMRDKARGWSKYMADHDYFEHAGRAEHGNENIAYAGSKYVKADEMAEILFRGWVMSYGHNNNLLEGMISGQTIGVYRDKGGVTWATWRGFLASSMGRYSKDIYTIDDPTKVTGKSNKSEIVWSPELEQKIADLYNKKHPGKNVRGKTRSTDVDFYEDFGTAPRQALVLTPDKESVAKAKAELDASNRRLSEAQKAYDVALEAYNECVGRVKDNERRVAKAPAKIAEAKRVAAENLTAAQAKLGEAQAALDRTTADVATAKAAWDAAVEEAESIVIPTEDPTIKAPAAPDHVNARVKGLGLVRLDWDPDFDVEGYVVYRKRGNGPTEVMGYYRGSSTIDDKASWDGPTYYFVASYVLDENGNKVIGNPSKFVYALATTLTPVTDVQSSMGLEGGLIVGWEPNVDADGYHVFRKIGKTGAFKYIGTRPRHQNSFNDRNYALGEFNFYRVYAFKKKDDGTSLMSGPGSYSYSFGPLDRPSYLRAKSARTGVVLSWKSVKGAERYLIYRTVGGKRVLIGWIEAGKPPIFVDTKAPKGIKVTYQIYACSTINGKTLTSFIPQNTSITFS